MSNPTPEATNKAAEPVEEENILQRFRRQVRNPELFSKLAELNIFLIVFYVLVVMNRIPQGCDSENWLSLDGKTECGQFPYPDEFLTISCPDITLKCAEYEKNRLLHDWAFLSQDIMSKMIDTGERPQFNAEEGVPIPADLSANHSSEVYVPFCECLVGKTQIDFNSDAYTADFVPASDPICQLSSLQTATYVVGFLIYIYICAERRPLFSFIAFLGFIGTVLGLLYNAECTSDEFAAMRGLVLILCGVTSTVMGMVVTIDILLNFFGPTAISILTFGRVKIKDIPAANDD